MRLSFRIKPSLSCKMIMMCRDYRAIAGVPPNCPLMSQRSWALHIFDSQSAWRTLFRTVGVGLALPSDTPLQVQACFYIPD